MAFSLTRLVRLGAAFVPDAMTRFPSTGRDLYPSFDDGPGEATEALLDKLEGLGMRCTFFFLGQQAERHPGIVRRAADNGHTIGSHGYRHVDAWSESAEKTVADLKHGYESLRETIGREITWVRPPHGRVRRSTLKWFNANGLRLSLWDVDPVDYRPGRTPQEVTESILAEARPGSIVVLHENGPVWSPEHTVGGCMERLVGAGFALAPFPEDWFAVESKSPDR